MLPLSVWWQYFTFPKSPRQDLHHQINLVSYPGHSFGGVCRDAVSVFNVKKGKKRSIARLNYIKPPSNFPATPLPANLSPTTHLFYRHHHNHQCAQTVWIPLFLSHNPSLSAIALGKSFKRYPCPYRVIEYKFLRVGQHRCVHM